MVVTKGTKAGDICSFVSLIPNELSFGRIERITKKFGLTLTFAILTYEGESKKSDSKHYVFIRKFELNLTTRLLTLTLKYEYVPVFHMS